MRRLRSRRSWCETADSDSADDGRQVGDAQLAVGQRVDEPDAGRIAQDGERRRQLFGGTLVEERPGRGGVSAGTVRRRSRWQIVII